MGQREAIVSIPLSKQKTLRILATKSDIKSTQHRQISKCQHTTTSQRPPVSMATPAFSTTQERWSAVVNRDPDAVGAFVYAVKTTGIYCRPDCKARLARQANVVFFDTPSLAHEAGYRACRRCRPELLETQQEDPLLSKIRYAVFLVEENASRRQKISLADLSAQVGLSKWHLQRVFSRLVGRSPAELANSIINTVEGSPQSAVTQPDDSTPAEAIMSQPEPQNHATWDIQAFDNIDWDSEVAGNTEVDDVLRDLFPELYMEIPG